MLVAAAVCPHPPLLVPELASGAAADLEGLRAACRRAVEALGAARPHVVAVVGGGARTAEHPPDAAGDLAPYGVPHRIGPGAPTLPLSLTVGRYLLELAGWTGPTVWQEVAAGSDPGACGVLGGALASRAERVALLAMGDGSARRSERAPGWVDERAQPYDAAVAGALARADAAALAALVPGDAAELLAAGRAAWQVLAGAAAAGRFHAELLADEAPYGVGYLVAVWRAVPVVG